jgi:ethanolamine utilization protein EutN
MFLGKVVGTVWSTKKSPDLEGVRFLIVHPYDLDKEPNRNIVVIETSSSWLIGLAPEPAKW